MSQPWTRGGFAMRDLCFGLAALAVAAALVIAASAGARKRAQLAAAQNQLRWIAGVTTSYAADFEDRIWGLSWKAGVWYPFAGHTVIQPTDLRANAVQAIDLLHRRAGRPDMRSHPPGTRPPCTAICRCWTIWIEMRRICRSFRRAISIG